MSKRVKNRLRHLNLVQQFNLVSFAILVSGMLIIGWWVGQRIRVGVINRTTATIALYVDSFILLNRQNSSTSSRTSRCS